MGTSLWWGKWCLGVKLRTGGVPSFGGGQVVWMGHSPQGFPGAPVPRGGQDVVFVILHNGFPENPGARSLPVAKTRLVREWCVPGGHPHVSPLRRWSPARVPLARLLCQVPRPMLWKPLGTSSVQLQHCPGKPCPQGTCVLGTRHCWALGGTHWLQGNIRGPGCCRGSRSISELCP